jgi:hypothetical protein|eukprot:4002356-Prymnesium_polylepis.1
MVFSAVQLSPTEPFELALPKGVEFVVCQVALAQPPSVGTTAVVSVRTASCEVILCTLCVKHEQQSFVQSKPLRFRAHDKAVLFVSG